MRTHESKILQDEAYQYIQKRIAEGTLEFNVIYSETRIAKEIGISRTPVRDAVHRLFQDGLIDIIPNKGFTLHKLNEQDVIETYEVRSAIEGYCVRKAAAECSSSSVQLLLSRLDDSIALQEDILKKTHDPDAFAQEDQRFHALLVEHSGNETFIDVFSHYMYRINKLAAYSLTKEGRMEATLAEHLDITAKIRQGRAEEAYAATLYHMKAPMDINMETVYQPEAAQN